ncbi:DNA-binding protein [Mycobacteroides abscessus subsp. abscessus]|uniref:helix-turn-helix domain-containing protein n=1 Tax=Mycobacteroides abscessus TaxID=36809 RepID=UPI000927CB94|nr:helix-turn-helix domain-containing protein [Mycobacteroides abscessus]SID63459.1 DNA-binding protein [Mycobacteroides abscessus subsp. abscessus]SIE81978.1 DNA-binding protein [Mycobacteroides abscessus subsp. abscessus]SIF72694.1 DNA-binding protein [Mycobacteroides abscessus subsp. abscessus]SIF73596.1 DNA-binding protein [Mycobacteroides abscessus subsp. abscessus]SIH44364.1 DNA-binding protein [Mycobacteroides abscessus subsp. abscessus]
MAESDPVAAALTALVAAIREQVLAEVAAATPPKPPAGDPPRELLTMKEALERLRVSKATLDRLLRQGRLRKVKIGSRAFVPEEEISRFIAEASVD